MPYDPSSSVPNNYSDLLQAETGRILPEMINRGRVRSWWASLTGFGIPSEPWREEWGDTLSRNIRERTIPTSGIGSGWVPVMSNGPLGQNNNCGYQPLQLLSASNLRTTQLFENWIDSDVLCVNNIRSKLSLKDDIKYVVKNLSENVADIWEIQNRRQYAQAAQTHICFNPNIPTMQPVNPWDFPASPPTSPISQLYLDRLRVQLKQNAAGMPNDIGQSGAYAREDGNDVFAVVMSTEMQQALFQLSGINGTNGQWGWNNGSRINWDRRYAEPSRLLKAFGVDRSYMGWFHIIDDKAPRFNYVNGAFVEQPYYANASATIGQSAVVNPNYLTAQFEVVIPFLPTVVKRLTPRAFSSAGSGTSFKPWNYVGEPQWMNYFDRQFNATLRNGYWTVGMSAAWMAELIDNGYVILCQRPCAGELEMVACPQAVSGVYIG